MFINALLIDALFLTLIHVVEKKQTGRSMWKPYYFVALYPLAFVFVYVLIFFPPGDNYIFLGVWKSFFLFLGCVGLSFVGPDFLGMKRPDDLLEKSSLHLFLSQNGNLKVLVFLVSLLFIMLHTLIHVYVYRFV